MLVLRNNKKSGFLQNRCGEVKNNEFFISIVSNEKSSRKIQICRFEVEDRVCSLSLRAFGSRHEVGIGVPEGKVCKHG